MIAFILAILVSIATPCATEDSTLCHWDGGANGQGLHYVAVSDDLILYY